MKGSRRQRALIGLILESQLKMGEQFGYCSPSIDFENVRSGEGGQEEGGIGNKGRGVRGMKRSPDRGTKRGVRRGLKVQRQRLVVREGIRGGDRYPVRQGGSQCGLDTGSIRLVDHSCTK